MTTPSDCRLCGVCCFSNSETYVRLLGDDWAALGDQADEVAQFIGNRAYMRMKHGHCVALKRMRDVDGTQRFHCSIYDQRPTLCRELERGSPECEGERETKNATVDVQGNRDVGNEDDVA